MPLSPVSFLKLLAAIRRYLDHLPPGIDVRAVDRPDSTRYVLPGDCGVAVAWLLGHGHSPIHRIIAGRRLFEGKAAHRHLKEIAKEEMAGVRPRIKLHPGFDWHLSRDRETRHFLLMGSVGGGKTQIIMPLVLAAIERGDQLVIYDIKADFTSSLNTPFIFLAPWDSRSMVGMSPRIVSMLKMPGNLPQLIP